MLDKEAIQELSKAQAIASANSAIDRESTGAVALPNDFKMHDLEVYMPTRRRLRGSMTTSVIKDFSEYVTKNEEPGAAVFIDPERMTAIAVLNLGTTDKPGHADNLAILEAKKTAAYEVLRRIANGNPLKQTDVAEFLEDWISIIECSRDGDLIPTRTAIAAVRNIAIETLKKLGNEEKQLSATKSTFENVQATSAETIPTIISFHCIPYKDLPARIFDMRLGILTGGDKPAINLRIVKIEDHEERMANELADKIVASLQGIHVMLGKYVVK